MSNNIPVNGWPQLKDLEAVQPILNRLDKIEAWKRTVKEETFTGDDITIENALALPARSLITEIEPIQDLHGYDKPWVGGAYKNKLPYDLATMKTINTDGTWNDNVYTVGGVSFTVADGVVYLSGTATGLVMFYIAPNIDDALVADASYILTGAIDGNIQVGISQKGFDSGSGLTFVNSFTISDPSVRINIASGVNTNGKVVKPMIRLSTESDASFAPYSNICPISGRTEARVDTENGDSTESAYAVIQLGTTVYGADINWDTGVMTVLDAIADMGDLTWTYNSTSQVFNSSALPGATTENVYTDAISSSYKEHQTGMSAMVNGDFRVLDGVMTVKDTAYTDATAFKTAVTGQTVCYKLATPTTIQLTPTQLQMLKGYNHITLSDGYGTIELKALTGANWS